MSLETITEQIHEYMYEKLNDSSETDNESRIKHISGYNRKRKPEWRNARSNPKKPSNNPNGNDKPINRKYNSDQPENKSYNTDCHKCGRPNWTRTHNCPAREQKCRNCQKLGHFAKVCRSAKRIQYIQDETASSASNDNWTPDKIHLILERIQATTSTRTKEKFFTKRLLVNNQPIEFIIDSGSPVTIIPNREFNRSTELRPVKNQYKDVNDNDILFVGQTIAEVETEMGKLQLPLLVTKKSTNPLLGLDWMKKLDIKIEDPMKTKIIQNVKETDMEKELKQNLQNYSKQTKQSKMSKSK